MFQEETYNEKWYYSVELEPGRITKGFDFKNIASARKTLDALDVGGHSVLDLSTMEGMFATLLARRGAEVTATDTIDNSARVAMLKHAYDVAFQYIPHINLEDQAAFLFKHQLSSSFDPARGLVSSQTTPFGYDVVFSSGVMYHVLSPLHYILQLRRLVKLGGKVVIETACAVSDEIELHHDYRHEGFVYGGSCSWFMSTGALDLFLRACFLRPLGFTYVPSIVNSDLKVVRLGLVAEAVEDRPIAASLLERIQHGEIVRSFDYKPLYESAQLTGSVAEPVSCDVGGLYPIGDKLSVVDFSDNPEFTYEPEYLRLYLGDQ